MLGWEGPKKKAIDTREEKNRTRIGRIRLKNRDRKGKKVPDTNGTVRFFHGLRIIGLAARWFFCYFNRTLIFLALSGRDYM